MLPKWVGFVEDLPGYGSPFCYIYLDMIYMKKISPGDFSLFLILFIGYGYGFGGGDVGGAPTGTRIRTRTRTHFI